MLADFARFIRDLLGIIAAVAAAVLPVRFWDRLEPYVPVSACAAASGLLTMLAGVAIGIPGFLQHAAEIASATTQAMLTVAATPGISDEAVTTAMPMGLTALSPFTFLLLTPTGWATLYLGGSGLLRAAGAVLGDPRGDPILSIVDAAVLRAAGRTRTRIARERREALEGPPVPDRIVSGAKAGFPQADLVIVAARRHMGWDAGTILLTDGPAYRVGESSERTIAGRLRTLYPITEHKDLEAFRRAVRYDRPDS